jgi:hypothetical protein
MKQCQEEFLGLEVQWKNYSWPEDRKKLDHPDVREKKQMASQQECL